MPTEYRIHPSVGIARVGDGTEVFVGPEAVGDPLPGTDDGKFRESSDGPIRRQAARFRIFAFDYDDQDPGTLLDVREVTAADADIRWTVHMVNRKSHTFGRNGERILSVNDPEAQTVEAPGDEVSLDGEALGVAVHLGRIRQEEQGTLLCIPGHGLAGSPTNAPLGRLINPGWWDDVADGPVTATIKLHSGDGGEVDALPAWVVTGVPSFAHYVDCMVTLFDLAEDIAIRSHGQTPPAQVSFSKHIYPVLRRVAGTSWVNKAARGPHGPGGEVDFSDESLLAVLSDNDTSPGSRPALARRKVFRNLREPAGPGGGNMPQLKGQLTLTETQYERFRKWADGDFVADWGGEPTYPTYESLPMVDRPAAMDAVHLDSIVGGSFVPGIEVGSDVGAATTWEAPFRVRRDLPPGTLTAQLAIPWQDDFNACGADWWPSARPSWTTENGSTFRDWVPDSWDAEDMLENWTLLGFVRAVTRPNRPVEYRETERRLR